MPSPTFAVLDYDPTFAFTGVVDVTGGVAAGKLLGLVGSTVVLADPVAAAGVVQAVGIAAHAAADGERVLVLPVCTVYDDGYGGLQGEVLYAAAGGAYSITKLSGTGDLVQVVGYGSMQDKVIKLAIQPTPLVA